MFDILMQAAGLNTEGFVGKVKAVLCWAIDKSGPIAPIVAGAALAILAVLFILDEGKGYISTLLRILIGVALLIFIPTFLSQAFGINLGCSGGVGVI